MAETTSTLTLAGDFFLGPGFDPEEAAALRELLQQGALTVINFEGALAGPRARRKAINLGMVADAVQYLPNSLLTLANNHVLDFGQDGLRKTLERFNSAGIAWFGLETRYGAADNYIIFEHQGARICLAGFGWRNEECVEATADAPGVVNFDRSGIDRTLERLAEESYDFLLVYVHFGYEHEYFPLPLHVGMCRYLIDQGVDLVYGSHTHCIQPYEIYRGRYIFYGLGNFFFSPGRERYPMESDRGLVIELGLSKADRSIQVKRARRMQYSRVRQGFEIGDDPSYLCNDLLEINDLESYGRNYKQIRRRNRNPRPVLLYGHPFINALKYRVWLAIVQVTGYLGLRRTIKKLLGWG